MNKITEFKTAATRIRQHDDDSRETHDAMFMAGHLAPEMWDEYEATKAKLDAMLTALEKAWFYWYGLSLDLRQAVLFQLGINELRRASGEELLDESGLPPVPTDNEDEDDSPDGESFYERLNNATRRALGDF